MRAYILLALIVLFTLLLGYAVWPLLHPYMGQIKFWLIELKQFCHQNPLAGYAVYGMLLSFILFFGLPFSMLIMLMAGITYDFWEATFLVTLCRLMVAIAAFLLVRHLMIENMEKPQPALFKRFERHPKVGLLLARLAPLPDTTVNYAMGAVSINCMQYAAISLIGMIPLSLFCVWVGNELGSITQLISVFN